MTAPAWALTAIPGRGVANAVLPDKANAAAHRLIAEPEPDDG